MAAISLRGVSKRYGRQAVVDRLDLEVQAGEFMVLVGPSGCGKSTTLRMIAGLEEVSAGRLLIGGRDVTHAEPHERDTAMVFQSYALYPHMTVHMNMAFGLLRTTKLPKAEIERRVPVRQPQVCLFDEPLSNLDAKLRTHMRGELEKLHAELGITIVYVTHDQVEAMTLGIRIAVMEGGRLQQLARRWTSTDGLPRGSLLRSSARRR